MSSKCFHTFDLSSKNKCWLGSSAREGPRSNKLMNRCFIVVRVIGEGIGQRRISEPWRRYRHSKWRTMHRYYYLTCSLTAILWRYFSWYSDFYERFCWTRTAYDARYTASPLVNSCVNRLQRNVVTISNVLCDWLHSWHQWLIKTVVQRSKYAQTKTSM